MPSSKPVLEVDLSKIGELFKFERSSKPMAERDSAGLPYTDSEHIQLLQREYEEAAALGGREAIDKCFK